MVIKEYSTSFGHSISITEDEVSISGIKIPISSIRDVIHYPISGNMRGVGGCIKIVTDDKPELPKINPQRGLEVIFQGKANVGFDIAIGNCFWYGGDYSENGWTVQNKETEEIVKVIKEMIRNSD